ncbi:YgdB family protein [Dickeya dianthicola]|uniref:YgdB family protein n=1 Tax=Dickeya dianthicola TaxID=204039 RepID=UPI0018661F2F|nr:YgdB family protein [Dickeya dianthicola]
MQGRRQQGSILVIVMLVMMIGLLMLGGLQRQLDIQLQQGIDEQRFWQAFNQGLSSLNWGMGLRWQTTDEWQCQAQQSAQLRACLRMNGEDHAGLLRGEGRIAGDPQPLTLYHRVMADAAVADGGIRPVAGGWLDFCPDAAELACVPAQ